MSATVINTSTPTTTPRRNTTTGLIRDSEELFDEMSVPHNHHDAFYPRRLRKNSIAVHTLAGDTLAQSPDQAIKHGLDEGSPAGQVGQNTNLNFNLLRTPSITRRDDKHRSMTEAELAAEIMTPAQINELHTKLVTQPSPESLEHSRQRRASIKEGRKIAIDFIRSRTNSRAAQMGSPELGHGFPTASSPKKSSATTIYSPVSESEEEEKSAAGGWLYSPISEAEEGGTKGQADGHGQQGSS